MNAENYLELFIDLKVTLENNQELASIRYFQQDGALPHFGLEIREYSNADFELSIGRRGRIKRAVRSLDLTPYHFPLYRQSAVDISALRKKVGCLNTKCNI